MSVVPQALVPKLQDRQLGSWADLGDDGDGLGEFQDSRIKAIPQQNHILPSGYLTVSY